LDFVTVEDRGKGKFAPTLYWSKHPITIQDSSIENLVYLAFCSKIIPALQAFSTTRLPPANKIVVVRLMWLNLPLLQYDNKVNVKQSVKITEF